MAYRVWIGNTPIDCETPEAALELARHNNEGDAAQQPRNEHPRPPTDNVGSRWTEKRVAEFFKLIDGNQRKLIDTLLEHGNDGRTDQQLMSLLGFDDGRALGGVFAGMWKNAKKVGADPGCLYVKEPVTIAGRKAVEYFLNESFRQTAESYRKTEQ